MSDIENSENFTEQIFSILQYFNVLVSSHSSLILILPKNKCQEKYGSIDDLSKSMINKLLKNTEGMPLLILSTLFVGGGGGGGSGKLRGYFLDQN